MKKSFFVLLVVALMLSACSLKEETVKLSITQTAVAVVETNLAKSEENFLKEITQQAHNFQSTQKAYDAEILSTQEAHNLLAQNLAKTQEVQSLISTEQVSVIATQKAIAKDEENKQAIIDRAADARANPEVDGQDPVLDELLLQTDVSIKEKNYEFKGIRYSEPPISGVNIASRFVYYDFSNSENTFIRIMATYNKLMLPWDFKQVIEGSENGGWTKIIVNQEPYFYKDTSWGSQLASHIDLGEGCSVVVYVNTQYDYSMNGWIDYLVDARRIILDSNLPVCEGT